MLPRDTDEGLLLSLLHILGCTAFLSYHNFLLIKNKTRPQVANANTLLLETRRREAEQLAKQRTLKGLTSGWHTPEPMPQKVLLFEATEKAYRILLLYLLNMNKMELVCYSR